MMSHKKSISLEDTHMVKPLLFELNCVAFEFWIPVSWSRDMS